MAPVDEEQKDSVPDPPIVAELKKIDDEYLKIEKEYEREVEELQRKFEEKQRPCLEKRAELLAQKAGDEEGPVTGTPALRGFWLKALRNHPAFEEEVEEWDEPVLEYLSDIKKELLDPENSESGFKLEFIFVENPYFENTVLTKEYHTKEISPYTGDSQVLEIKSSEINWKAGKDVTVEMTKKKVKGGGAKKAKQAKVKEEPRSSFFRHFFRNLEEGGSLPDDIDPEELQRICDDSDDEGDEGQIITFLMENDHEAGCALRDNIIPFAVRWYTGEADPTDDDDDEGDEDDDDDDDDDGGEDSDDDDDDDDESDDEPPRGKKGAPKAKAGGKTKGEGNKEECKQQ